MHVTRRMLWRTRVCRRQLRVTAALRAYGGGRVYIRSARTGVLRERMALRGEHGERILDGVLRRHRRCVHDEPWLLRVPDMHGRRVYRAAVHSRGGSRLHAGEHALLRERQTLCFVLRGRRHALLP